jgi:hypothetical protein
LVGAASDPLRVTVKLAPEQAVPEPDVMLNKDGEGSVIVKFLD